MRKWWQELGPLPRTDEAVIGADSSLADSLRRVLADCSW